MACTQVSSIIYIYFYPYVPFMSYNIYSDALRNVSASKQTENGSNAFSTTHSGVVDLFATIGAMRNGDNSMKRLNGLIDAAFAEDPLLTAKILFYARDIRGGLGEREIFRKAIYHCANDERMREMVRKNIELIPAYGRWDDVFSLIGTPLEEDMWKLIKDQLNADTYYADVEGEPERISLLAKWMPSADTSSADTRALAKICAEKLGMSVYTYKRYIRNLRKHLKLLETDMSKKNWKEIDYEHIPSQAHMRHVKAFYRNDEERYKAYLDALSKGDAKVNASTLFPYEIVEKLTIGYHYYDRRRTSADTEQNAPYELMWKNLPNYVGEGKNVMVIADTSGSMHGRPMWTSTSLAIYFAERNKGPFANLYMTFSSRPQLIELKPNQSLTERVMQMLSGPWDGNTDLETALELLLYLAQHVNAKQEDLPQALVVITDMEIDQGSTCRSKPWETIVDVMAKKYRDAGYKMPNMVFWNVASRQDTHLADSKYKGVQMVSGSSAAVFKAVLGFIDGMTPLDAVRQTLDVPRYEAVRI